VLKVQGHRRRGRRPTSGERRLAAWAKAEWRARTTATSGGRSSG